MFDNGVCVQAIDEDLRPTGTELVAIPSSDVLVLECLADRPLDLFHQVGVLG